MSQTQFNHSIRVPRLYKIASVIAKEYNEGLGSVKQLVFEKKKKHPVSIGTVQFQHGFKIYFVF